MATGTAAPLGLAAGAAEELVAEVALDGRLVVPLDEVDVVLVSEVVVVVLTAEDDSELLLVVPLVVSLVALLPEVPYHIRSAKF